CTCRIAPPQRSWRQGESDGINGAKLGGASRSLSPCYCHVDVTLDPDQRNRVSAVLGMVRLQQVLPDQRKLKVWDAMPAQSDVRCPVTRDQLGRKIAHVTIGLTKL